LAGCVDDSLQQPAKPSKTATWCHDWTETSTIYSLRNERRLDRS
jgi:hypothetical protein